MARGRHVRRSGLLAWLFPDRAQPAWRTVHAQSLVLLSADVEGLQQEVEQLRAGQASTTAAAVMAELRAERLERELADARADLAAVREALAAVREASAAVREDSAAVRRDSAALREDLVWAFAERRLPVDAPRVVDLTRPVAGTA